MEIMQGIYLKFGGEWNGRSHDKMKNVLHLPGGPFGAIRKIKESIAISEAKINSLTTFIKKMEKNPFQTWKLRKICIVRIHFSKLA